MILISAAGVGGAILLLIAAMVTSNLTLVYVSIGVSAAAALLLAAGVLVRRELFAPRRASTGDAGAAAAASPGAAVTSHGAVASRGATAAVAELSAVAGATVAARPVGRVLAGAGRSASTRQDAFGHPRPTAATAPPDSEVVLVVGGRRRFHVAGCVRLVGRVAEELTIDEALEEGFSPCPTCMPDAVSAPWGELDTSETRSVGAAAPVAPAGQGQSEHAAPILAGPDLWASMPAMAGSPADLVAPGAAHADEPAYGEPVAVASAVAAGETREAGETDEPGGVSEAIELSEHGTPGEGDDSAVVAGFTGAVGEVEAQSPATGAAEPEPGPSTDWRTEPADSGAHDMRPRWVAGADVRPADMSTAAYDLGVGAFDTGIGSFEAGMPFPEPDAPPEAAATPSEPDAASAEPDVAPSDAAGAPSEVTDASAEAHAASSAAAVVAPGAVGVWEVDVALPEVEVASAEAAAAQPAAAGAREADVGSSHAVATPPQPRAVPANSPEAAVWVVRGVSRYHLKDCVLIHVVDDADVDRTTLGEAERLGCTACRACHSD